MATPLSLDSAARPRYLAAITQTTGIAATALGCFVAAGWLLTHPAWVQVRATFAPMQFNTALCFLLLGLGLLLRGLGASDTLVRTLVALPALISAVTLLQYLTGGDLGIDQLFHRSGLLVQTSHPGRMAPDSALGCLFAAAALWLRSQRSFAVASLGAFTTTLGGVVLIAYATGLAAEPGTSSVTRMALLSALGFSLLGIGLVTEGLRHRHTRSQEGAWRIPIAAGVATVLLMLLFWQALEHREAAQVQAMLDAAAERIQAEMEAQLSSRSESLTLLATLLQIQDRPAAGGWESDVRLLSGRYPEVVAVEWISSDWQVPWVFPEDAAVTPLAPLLRPGGELRRQLTSIRHQEGAVAAAGPITLGDGVRGFRLFVPLRLQDGETGYLSGVLRTDRLLDSLLGDVAPSYFVHVESAGGVLYDRTVATGEELYAWSRRLEVNAPAGITWSLVVRPSSLLLPVQRSRLTVLILTAGLSLALLLTAALRLRQTALAHARELAQVNRSLTAEIEQHRRAEDEIRRLNAELEARVGQRTRELAQSNEELKQFASFISHELRQPLNTVALWTDLLRTTNAEALDEKGQRYLDEIRSAIQRMGELISAQLALSDLSSQDSQSEPVALGRVVEELQKDLAPTLSQAGAVLQVEPLPTVRGDSRQIYQLLRNLVDNAVKYRRPEVPLRIRIWSEAGTGSGAEPHDGCSVYVEDNGRGFPAEDNVRIFRLFERLDPGDGKGSGMGLAICHRVVQRLGGKLEAEGRPGEGATFILRLPRDLVERSAEAGETRAVSPASG